MRHIWILLAATIPAAAPAADPVAIPLPAGLVDATAISGHAVPEVIVDEGAEARLIDVSADSALRVPRAALTMARTDEERIALLAVALSYKVGFARSTGPAAVPPLLAGLLAADIEDGIEARDRRDPFLKLPTRTRSWAPAAEADRGRSLDPRAVRAVAWARASGVCETVVVALLDRLASPGTIDPAIGADARRISAGLGTARFDPDPHCPG